MVVWKVNKEYLATDHTMPAYLVEVRKVEARFYGLDFKFIPRKDNYVTNVLARYVSSWSLGPPKVFIEKISKSLAIPSHVAIVIHEVYDRLKNSSIDTPKGELAASLEYGDTWMSDICKYLKGLIDPTLDDRVEIFSKNIMMYSIIEGISWAMTWRYRKIYTCF